MLRGPVCRSLASRALSFMASERLAVQTKSSVLFGFRAWSQSAGANMQVCSEIPCLSRLNWERIPSSLMVKNIPATLMPNSLIIDLPPSTVHLSVCDDAPSHLREIAPLEALNRNARRPKRPNHGKRPCSHVRRRSKRLK